MPRPADAEFRRLRDIEIVIGVLRTLAAIIPIWIVGDKFSPQHLWTYMPAVLALTGALVILSVVRQLMSYWIVDPEHRFFNDARRVAAFIDRTRQRGYISLRIPSELLTLKFVNLVLQPIGWAILLAFFLGGYRYVMDGLSNGQPWPIYAGLVYKWAMPAMVVIFSIQAISGGVRTIRSTDVNDFPMTGALLGTDKVK